MTKVENAGDRTDHWAQKNNAFNSSLTTEGINDAVRVSETEKYVCSPDLEFLSLLTFGC